MKKDVGSILILVALGLFALPTMLIIICLFGEAQLHSSVPEADAPWVVCETTVELNVRYEPDGSEVFTVLPEGTYVYAQLPERRGNERWAQIELPEGYFWVCSSKGGKDYLVELPD